MIPDKATILRFCLSLVKADDRSGNRSRERYRRVTLTAATSALARGASVLSALASVPLTITYLGTPRFALWMTINSLMAMLMFADLGLGNGLMTAIAESHGKDDMRMARRYISSAFFMLSALGLGVLLMLAVGYGHIPWAHFLGAESGKATQEAPLAVTIFFVCFALNLPLAIVHRVQTGFQNGYVNNAWNGVGVLLGFAGILICAKMRAGVPWLVLSFGAGPVVAAVLNAIQLFRSRPELRPTHKEFHWLTLRQLLSVGLGFLILQAALAMAVGSDNFVIAHLLGPGAVAEYSVAMRIFTIVPGILSMVLIPLWPAYGESVARGDAGWAIRALKRSLIAISTVTVVAAIVLTFSGKWIIALWVGDRVHPSLWLLSGMGLWMVVNGIANVVSVFLNSINRVREQVVFALAMAASTLGLEFFFTPKLGLPAMIWSTNVSYLCFVLVPIAVFFPRLIRTLTHTSKPEAAGVPFKYPALAGQGD